MAASASFKVLLVGDGLADAIRGLLGRYGIALHLAKDGAAIRGSFWGAPEAGIVGHSVFARADTPVHSVLHETAHIVCMSAERRRQLDGNAGGDELEEAAVCYLQILLADQLPGVGRQRLMQDMDAWGYSFRLGTTNAWFSQDADDARAWLEAANLIDSQQAPSWLLRQ